MIIGILASQGAFIEHRNALQRSGTDTRLVRTSAELTGLDGLIIPGGESTTISRLIYDSDLAQAIIDLAAEGLPIMGTCAGMIIMANSISEPGVTSLGLMNISVKRNAFGRQRESFETELKLPVLGDIPFPGVFIRAPIIEHSNSSVDILCRLDDSTMVAARQGRLLATAFHPELTDDLRLHQYFLDIVSGDR